MKKKNYAGSENRSPLIKEKEPLLYRVPKNSTKKETINEDQEGCRLG
jgi:hypothetical protein